METIREVYVKHHTYRESERESKQERLRYEQQSKLKLRIYMYLIDQIHLILVMAKKPL